MNYFPMSLAGGQAFCNRVDELKRLNYNIENNVASLLIAPRRYGKTSLALQAIRKHKWLHVHIDLYKALDEEDIARLILNGIGQLLGKLETSPQKLIKLAKDFFSPFHLKFNLAKVGIAVEFGQKQDPSIAVILSALERLDHLLKKRKETAVVFLDEFQTVAELANNTQIEAALREAVQKSEKVRYIFSGSHRHLIEKMFNDKARPFYRICDEIYIHRINAEDYCTYINKASKKRWNTVLSDNIISVILALTDCHPYYVNKLCSTAWISDEKPTEASLRNCWQDYLLEQRSQVEQELSLLPANQRRILFNLAVENGCSEPYGQEVSAHWKLSSTSIHRAMKALIEKDYVFIDSNKIYRVLDPLFNAVLIIN